MLRRSPAFAFCSVILSVTPARGAESWLDPDAADAATASASPDALVSGRTSPADGERRSPLRARPEQRLEGGVALGVASEFWSHGAVGTGPRLEVAIGLGRGLAVVLGEAARFSFGPSGAPAMMAFDLQTGLGFGAPFQTRTGVGVVLLVGAERLSTSTTIEGLMTWSVTGSLGPRASLAVGPIDLWLGADVLVRSSTLEIEGRDPLGVPTLTGQLSLGGFLPAFANPRSSR
jgi:hypothetical protein